MKSALTTFLCIFSVIVTGQDWQWALNMQQTNQDLSTLMSKDREGNIIICGTFKEGTPIFGNDTLHHVSRQNYFIAKMSPDGQPLWAIQPITKLEDFGLVGAFYGLSTDNIGNIYIAGTFVDSISYGNKTVYSVHADSMDNTHLYYAKLKPNGECIYLHNGDSKTYSWAHEHVADAAGNAFLTGTMRGETTIAGETFTSENGSGIFGVAFLAALEPDGSVKWMKQFVNQRSPTYASAMTMGVDGNLRVSGGFRDSVRYDGVTLRSNWRTNFYLFEIDVDGKVVDNHATYGAVEVNANRSLSINDIKINSQNETVLCGSFSGDLLNFDGEYVANLGDNRTNFVAVLDGSFNSTWIRDAGHIDGGWVIRPAIDINDKDEIYLCSVFEGNSEVDGHPIVSAGSTDIVLTKFNRRGELKYVDRLGGPSGEYGYGISAFDNDKVCIMGDFRGYIEFSRQTFLYSTGSVDAFVACADFSVVNVKDFSAFANVKMGPNPTKDYIHISSDEIIDRYWIYDGLGKLLYTGQNNELSFRINIDNLTTGEYYLVGRIKGKKGVLKLLKV